MVVAQLVEQLLPTSEICSSNPIVSKILSANLTFKIEKTKIKEKEAGSGPFYHYEDKSSIEQMSSPPAAEMSAVVCIFTAAEMGEFVHFL